MSKGNKTHRDTPLLGDDLTGELLGPIPCVHKFNLICLAPNLKHKLSQGTLGSEVEALQYSGETQQFPQWTSTCRQQRKYTLVSSYSFSTAYLESDHGGIRSSKLVLVDLAWSVSTLGSILPAGPWKPQRKGTQEASWLKILTQTTSTGYFLRPTLVY